MKYGKHLLKQMKDPEFLKALAQEGLIIDIQEEICRLMEENNISRVELAKRMGKTKGFITQILNSGRNLTLRTVADVFTALGAEITVKAKTRRVDSSIAVIYDLGEYKRKYQIQLEPSLRYTYKRKSKGYESKNEIASCA